MEILVLLAVSAVAYLLFLKKKPATSTSPKPSQSATPRKGTKRASKINSPMPPGYQMYASNLPIAGIIYRKDKAVKFTQDSGQSLELQREADNEFDPNAIKLIGVTQRDRYFIGYLPKELSAQIVSTGFFEKVKPRLMLTYFDGDDFIDIQYQIIGPKSEKALFDIYLKEQPADTSQKEYIKFFALNGPKDLTLGQASDIISAHMKESPEAEQAEWEGYSEILEQFDDADFREGYEIKKVSKAVLNKALEQLRAEGRTYAYLANNIDEVIDRVVQNKS
jgi:hypothetical protein